MRFIHIPWFHENLFSSTMHIHNNVRKYRIKIGRRRAKILLEGIKD